LPDDIFGSVLVGDDVIGLDVLRSVGVDVGILIFDIGRSILKKTLKKKHFTIESVILDDRGLNFGKLHGLFGKFNFGRNFFEGKLLATTTV
jgi:hypothetical protein